MIACANVRRASCSRMGRASCPPMAETGSVGVLARNDLEHSRPRLRHRYDLIAYTPMTSNSVAGTTPGSARSGRASEAGSPIDFAMRSTR